MRAENSWLALAGLFWLKPGRNLVGSDASSDVLLPGRAPGIAGYLDRTSEGVFWVDASALGVEAAARPGPSSRLEPDTSEEPTYVRFDDLQMVLIQRAARFGIRLWDNLRTERQTHPPRTWFDVDAAFRVPARFSALPPGFTANAPSASGVDAELPLDGAVTFAWAGRALQLDATKDDDGSYFIRFWDLTAQASTYPSGRYLNSTFDEDGNGVLDFNYSRNPPCAFTPYATCLFAPRQNRLDFAVRAGETYAHA